MLDGAGGIADGGFKGVAVWGAVADGEPAPRLGNPHGEVDVVGAGVEGGVLAVLGDWAAVWVKDLQGDVAGPRCVASR